MIFAFLHVITEECIWKKKLLLWAFYLFLGHFFIECRNLDGFSQIGHFFTISLVFLNFILRFLQENYKQNKLLELEIGGGGLSLGTKPYYSI